MFKQWYESFRPYKTRRAMAVRQEPESVALWRKRKIQYVQGVADCKAGRLAEMGKCDAYNQGYSEQYALEQQQGVEL